MATQRFQCFDPFTGPFNELERYTCQIVVPIRHYPSRARLWAQNIVQIGTTTITLKSSDSGDDNAGRTLATLANSDFTESENNQYADFDISAISGEQAPKDRHYFIVMACTDVEDRFDWPLLQLDVREA